MKSINIIKSSKRSVYCSFCKNRVQNSAKSIVHKYRRIRISSFKKKLKPAELDISLKINILEDIDNFFLMSSSPMNSTIFPCASRTRFLENSFSNEHESMNMSSKSHITSDKTTPQQRLSDLTNEAIDLRESLSSMQLMPIQSIQFDRTSNLFLNYTDLFHGRINLQEQSAKVRASVNRTYPRIQSVNDF